MPARPATSDRRTGMPVPSIPRCIVGADLPAQRLGGPLRLLGVDGHARKVVQQPARRREARLGCRRSHHPPHARGQASGVQPQRPVARAEPGMAARTAVVGPFQRHRPEHRDEPLRAMPGQERPSAACARPPRALVRPVAVAARLHDAGRRFLQRTTRNAHVRAAASNAAKSPPAAVEPISAAVSSTTAPATFSAKPPFRPSRPARRKPRLAQALAPLDQLRRQRPQALALRDLRPRQRHRVARNGPRQRLAVDPRRQHPVRPVPRIPFRSAVAAGLAALSVALEQRPPAAGRRSTPVPVESPARFQDVHIHVWQHTILRSGI